MATIEGYTDPRVKLSPKARKALEAWERKKEEVFGSRQLLCGSSPALAQPYGVKIMKPTAVLKNAYLYYDAKDSPRVSDTIEDDSQGRFPNGTRVITGPVIELDAMWGSATTENTIYYISDEEDFNAMVEDFANGRNS